MIADFEPPKVGVMGRLLTKIGAVSDPDEQMLRDMRLTFRCQPELRRAVEQMIAWALEGVILPHGSWYRSNGMEELRRAFRWLLK